jgi:hypothetical protein
MPQYLAGWVKRVNPSSAILDDLNEDFIANEGDTAPTVVAPVAKVSEEQIKDIVTAIVDEKIANTKLSLSDEAIGQIRAIARVAAEVRATELAKPKVIEVHNQKTSEIIALGIQHEMFPKLLRAAQARTPDGFHLNIWLTGLPGSGKTHACKAVAKALGYEFEAESSLDADFKITGYRSPDGQYQDTAFFRRFTQGGEILLDEIDNFSPSALLATNSATGNSFAQFPHGHFQRHKDFLVMSCANTWGLGATGDFVGRTRQDAASLDRYIKLHWTTDEKLEMAIADLQHGSEGVRWCETVQAARRAAKAQGLKIIISPRATYFGISLLQQGFSPDDAIDMTFCAGLSDEQKKAIAPRSSSSFRGHSGQYIELLRTKGKMEAIKQYRADHGCDLYEAKVAIELLESAA